MSDFDWHVLLRAGVAGLGLRPAEFWSLTPAELRLLLGHRASPGMGRGEFEALSARWPDAPRRGVVASAGETEGAGRGECEG